MKTCFSFFFLMILIPLLSAQDFDISYYNSDIISIPKGASVNIKEIKYDWAPELVRLELPPPGSKSYQNYLRELKKLISKHHTSGSSAFAGKRANTPGPYLLRNFEGNIWGGSIPNDNDMAISNDGMLVAVINSSIYFFDVEQDSLKDAVSLAAFSDSLGLPNNKYDPKAIYDPGADRFIVVFLNGNTSTTNAIIVAFSQTNDPTGVWNLYAIDGNPLNSGVWSDYPMVAITEKELFITVNSIKDDSTWQAGFDGSIIWQINKNAGYKGDSLVSKLYSDIKYNGKLIRNLCPVQGGAEIYGPNIYLLSNRNFDLENDTIFILEVTDTIGALPVLNISLSVADTKYGVPPQARQPNHHTLETNDARILGGFIEGDQIQFVGNTVVTSTGYSGVYHGIITDLANSKLVTGTIISDDSLDFGYPNISFTGVSPDDRQAIISFNHTSETVFGGFSAIFFRDDETYSSLLTIKEGEDYINVMSGKTERWGDYSGSQRKYNEPGKVWVAGSFGTVKKLQGFPWRTNGTWIAELLTPDQVLHVPERTVNKIPSGMQIFPNPIIDKGYLEIELKEQSEFEILVYDINGKLIKVLLKDIVSAGRYGMHFSLNPLSTGTYFVMARSKGKIFAQKKLIISK